MPEPFDRLYARHDLTPDEIDRLENELYAYNAERTGFRDGRGLGFVIERDGARVGAVAGYTWGGVCELRQLWVREDCRGQRFGSELMEAAISEARRRGCAYIFLSTYDFQAPTFYKRLAFEQIAEIKDKPLGHTEFIFRRSLKQDHR
ncbi:MAG TPA: GNAT family N-acetyltransferase [Caulobacteraceae bacterium]|jgi:ribosomal protein S18 acetylase RimI-like enzyme